MSTAVLYPADYYLANYATRQEPLVEDFGKHLERLQPRLPPRGRWLDVGCGGGYFARAAVGKGWNVTGIDPSSDAIGIAKTIAPAAEFRIGNACDIPPTEKYDVISFWDSISYVPDLSRTLRWCSDALRPGGALVVKTPHLPPRFHVATQACLWWRPALRDSVAGVRRSIWHFTPASLRSLLAATGFVNPTHYWASEVPDGGSAFNARAIPRTILHWALHLIVGPHESFVMLARNP